MRAPGLSRGRGRLIVSLLAGLLVLLVGASLPFLGPLLVLLVVLAGLGLSAAELDALAAEAVIGLGEPESVP